MLVQKKHKSKATNPSHCLQFSMSNFSVAKLTKLQRNPASKKKHVACVFPCWLTSSRLSFTNSWQVFMNKLFFPPAKMSSETSNQTKIHGSHFPMLFHLTKAYLPAPTLNHEQAVFFLRQKCHQKPQTRPKSMGAIFQCFST